MDGSWDRFEGRRASSGKQKSKHQHDLLLGLGRRMSFLMGDHLMRMDSAVTLNMGTIFKVNICRVYFLKIKYFRVWFNFIIQLY